MTREFKNGKYEKTDQKKATRKQKSRDTTATREGEEGKGEKKVLRKKNSTGFACGYTLLKKRGGVGGEWML